MKFLKSALSQTTARSLTTATGAVICSIAIAVNTAAAQVLQPQPSQALDYPDALGEHRGQIAYDQFAGEYLMVRTRTTAGGEGALDQAYSLPPSFSTRWYPMIAEILNKFSRTEVAAVVPAPDQTYTLLNNDPENDGVSDAWIVMRDRDLPIPNESLQQLWIATTFGPRSVEIVDVAFAADRLYVLTKGNEGPSFVDANVLTAISSNGNVLWSRGIFLSVEASLNGMSVRSDSIYLTGDAVVDELPATRPIVVRMTSNGTLGQARVFPTLFNPILGQQPRLVFGNHQFPMLVAVDDSFDPIVVHLNPSSLSPIFSGGFSTSGSTLQGAGGFLRDALISGASQQLHLLFGSDSDAQYSANSQVLVMNQPWFGPSGAGLPTTVYSLNQGIIPTGASLLDTGSTVTVAGTAPSQNSWTGVRRLCHSDSAGLTYPCSYADTAVSTSYTPLESDVVLAGTFLLTAWLSDHPTAIRPSLPLESPVVLCE